MPNPQLIQDLQNLGAAAKQARLTFEEHQAVAAGFGRLYELLNAPEPAALAPAADAPSPCA